MTTKSPEVLPKATPEAATERRQSDRRSRDRRFAGRRLPPVVREILVATSLGPGSRELLALSLALARASRAHLHIVHGLAPPPLSSGAFGTGWLEPELCRHREEEVRQRIDAELTALAAPAPDSVFVEVGSPQRVIVEAVTKAEADLVVLGAPSGTVSGLGPVADRVLRQVPVPLLLLNGDLSVPPRKVLFGVDLSANSGDALRWGVSFLTQLYSGDDTVPELTALFALDPAQRKRSLELPRQETLQLAVSQLSELVDSVLGKGHGLHTEVHEGPPAATLIAAAQRNASDLVVLGTHGIGGYERYLLGGVATHLAHAAPSSILMVPPQAALRNREENTAKGQRWAKPQPPPDYYLG